MTEEELRQRAVQELQKTIALYANDIPIPEEDIEYDEEDHLCDFELELLAQSDDYVLEDENCYIEEDWLNEGHIDASKIQPGDVIVAISEEQKYLREHRHFIIQNNDKNLYGYAISTDYKHSNFNKNITGSKKETNIYIDDLASIYKTPINDHNNIPGYINVGKRVTVRVRPGSKFRKIAETKGQFIEFVNDCIHNYSIGVSNANKCWRSGKDSTFD